MKKAILWLLILSLFLLTLPGCRSDRAVEQDQSPITLYVGLGNGQVYFEALREAIRDVLGIEVQMIYQAAVDTTSACVLQFKNNDLPADIVATGSAVNPAYAALSCLDLMSYTHLADYFTYQKINEYTNSNGTVYQLPFTSKLLGITYNKTLMEENGWTLPETFADLLDLKRQCDDKGILFSVSSNAATGHGFNFLFNVMGADWLNTLEGSEWLNAFLGGKADVTKFAEEGTYFDRWVTNGLFGSIHAQDWNSQPEYSSQRALFFFDLANPVFSYAGEMTDRDGNPTGVVLNDEYGSMPWISEDGTNNCFTYYDNMFLAVNKKLADPDQQERLEKVRRILEFMTTETATSIFTDAYPDGYVALNNFKIDESRAYYSYKDSIEKGYIMPWYYSRFDTDTIVGTGGEVNSYLQSKGGSYSSIITALQTGNQKFLNRESTPLTAFRETLTYEETAKLNAVGAVLSLQNEFGQKGVHETVSAALIPYVNNPKDHQPFTSLGTVSTRVYAGDFMENDLETVISTKGQKVVGIKMTGTELKEIAAAGLTDGTAVYPYVLMTKEEIKDSEIYTVAVSTASLGTAELTAFTNAQAIVSVGGETVTAPIKSGIRQFLQGKTEVCASDLVLP